MSNKKALIEALNRDLADELGASILYLYQTSTATGWEGEELREFLSPEITGEMQHAIFLAEKIAALGGKPTTQPSQHKSPKEVKAMLKYDLQLEREAIQNGAQALERLIQMRHDTERSVAEVRQMQKSASHEMFQNIETSVHRGEIGVEVATQIRNLSATTLVVGSAFMTGGASVGVLGGGSVLRGATPRGEATNWRHVAAVFHLDRRLTSRPEAAHFRAGCSRCRPRDRSPRRSSAP